MASGEGGALGGAKILLKVMPAPLSVCKIVKYCGVWGGGSLGGAKILQKTMAPPLSVIKIVKYFGVTGGGGGIRGRQNPTKIRVPHLCH